jgi:hypothetical protein
MNANAYTDPVGGSGGSGWQSPWGDVQSAFGPTFGQSIFGSDSTGGTFGGTSNPSFSFIGNDSGGIGWPSLGGGQQTGIPSIGGGSGSGPTFTIGGGTTRPVNNTTTTSNWLGLPSISWGRIACFLLGLLLIAGGLFLIKPVQKTIIEVGKNSLKDTAIAAA